MLHIIKRKDTVNQKVLIVVFSSFLTFLVFSLDLNRRQHIELALNIIQQKEVNHLKSYTKINLLSR